MKLLKLFSIASLIAISLTACLKDKTEEQSAAPAPTEQASPAASTETPSQDATKPTDAAPAQQAPADAGHTQSAQ